MNIFSQEVIRVGAKCALSVVVQNVCSIKDVVLRIQFILHHAIYQK
jgi:hypothetical protein